MNKYDKILFSCTDSANKDIENTFAEPVTDGNFIIATDLKVLCKIPAKLTETTYKTDILRFESWDKVTKPEPNLSKKISIDEVRHILDKCPKIERKIERRAGCKDCDGEGFVDYSYKSSSGSCFLEELPCPICKGIGYLITEIALQETVIDENALIKIGYDYFLMGIFIKILDASVLLEKPVELVYQNKTNIGGTKLKIGEVEFLIMPIYRATPLKSAFYEIEI